MTDHVQFSTMHGRAVGVFTDSNERCFVVLTLWVHRAHRNQGIGTKLLQGVAKWCEHRGVRRIDVDDVTDRWRMPCNVYGRLGFVYRQTTGPEMYASPRALLCLNARNVSLCLIPARPTPTPPAPRPTPHTPGSTPHALRPTPAPRAPSHCRSAASYYSSSSARGRRRSEVCAPEYTLMVLMGLDGSRPMTGRKVRPRAWVRILEPMLPTDTTADALPSRLMSWSFWLLPL